jgi:hypothetical protein
VRLGSGGRRSCRRPGSSSSTPGIHFKGQKARRKTGRRFSTVGGRSSVEQTAPARERQGRQYSSGLGRAGVATWIQRRWLGRLELEGRLESEGDDAPQGAERADRAARRRRWFGAR